MVFTGIPAIGKRLDPQTAVLTRPELIPDALGVSLAFFSVFLALGAVALYVVPRLLGLLVKPDRVYPLYGFHYTVHRLSARMTNLKFFAWLFGDSSYIVHYLRGLGYDLSRVEQTGSNFGTEVQHETPFPGLRRHRHDGGRRALPGQCRVFQYVFPAVPGVDRAAQLPGQQHRLPGGGQDG